MNDPIHKTLAAGRWFELTLAEQLGNVGSEVGRAIKYRKQNEKDKEQKALDRAFELLDLTISDSRFVKRLKEICRAREVLADAFYGDNVYHTSFEFLEKYFYQYAYLARKDK